MWDELGFSPVATWKYENLPDFRFLGMENWQVVATTFFFVIAWPMAVVVAGGDGERTQCRPRRASQEMSARKRRSGRG